MRNSLLILCISISSLLNATHWIDHINNHAQRYCRPITILCMGNQLDTYISLAQQHTHAVIVILSEQSCNDNPMPHNSIHLRHNQSIATLKHLSQAEHFDIVIATDHAHTSDTKYAQTLYHMGEHVFVINADKTLAHFLAKYDFSHNESLWYAYHPITYLKRTQWLEPASDKNNVRQIVSTYTQKTLHKTYGPNSVHSDWCAGINLMTFKMLNGTIPHANQLESEMKRLYNIPHND